MLNCLRNMIQPIIEQMNIYLSDIAENLKSVVKNTLSSQVKYARVVLTDIPRTTS